MRKSTQNIIKTPILAVNHVKNNAIKEYLNESHIYIASLLKNGCPFLYIFFANTLLIYRNIPQRNLTDKEGILRTCFFLFITYFYSHHVVG